MDRTPRTGQATVVVHGRRYVGTTSFDGTSISLTGWRVSGRYQTSSGPAWTRHATAKSWAIASVDSVTWSSVGSVGLGGAA